MEFKEGKIVANRQDQGFLGLFLKAADELTIAQFRPDGFTVNRLRPYTGWSAILPEVLELWDIYVRVAKPEREILAAAVPKYIEWSPIEGPPDAS